ncbi:hypothetical protein [uncultured Methanobrevibacter sp.]|uniref:DNA replication complex subunit Gins51 n=1 Tax=uncultured Methanobrevibacter sp. TaxID=253161 RepID=UPI0025D8686A|nr:hypothetical protein [uncultured Methanobrevibacter sp.]
MVEFFQELRKIQKKERGNPSSLAKVDNNFYHQVYSYLHDLRENAGRDPFSKENYLLKDTQRIATEICERREHKIADAAIRNIHKSYHLFKGKAEFDLVDTTPLNLTPEEEKLYYILIDNFKNYRHNISHDIRDDEDLQSAKRDEITEDKIADDYEDQVINRLNKISNAQILDDEKRESIERQVSKSNIKNMENSHNQNEIFKKNQIDNKESKTQSQSQNQDSKVKSNQSSKNESINSRNIVSSQSNKNDQLNNILQSVDEQFVDLKEEDFLDTKANNKNLEENTLVIVFKDFNQIIGVDEKVYGPFKAQDLVVLPKANANVIVKSRKGRIVDNLI